MSQLLLSETVYTRFKPALDEITVPTAGPIDRFVHTLERRLKKGQSRFANRAARDRWQGSSGAYRLQFRWPQARRHLDDLARG